MMHIKSEDIKLKKMPSGESVSVLIGRHESSGSAKKQTVALVELDPSHSSSPHFHNEREETYYFLEGNGRARIGDVEVDIKEHDLIFTKPGEVHQFFNLGKTKLRYLVFTSPQWVPEDSHTV